MGFFRRKKEKEPGPLSPAAIDLLAMDTVNSVLMDVDLEDAAGGAMRPKVIRQTLLMFHVGEQILIHTRGVFKTDRERYEFTNRYLTCVDFYASSPDEGPSGLHATVAMKRVEEFLAEHGTVTPASFDTILDALSREAAGRISAPNDPAGDLVSYLSQKLLEHMQSFWLALGGSAPSESGSQ